MDLLRHMRAILPLVALAIIAGCAHEERPLPPAPPRVVQRAPLQPAQPVSAARYVAESGSIDLFVIRSSQLALQRSGSARVRQLASMLIDAHKGTSAQLSFAGRRLNLLPSATLQPNHQAMLNQLMSAWNFDTTYLTLERNVVREAVGLDRAYAGGGRSPTLRPVAAERAGITQRELAFLS
jgi:predicted outer membrane protein